MIEAFLRKLVTVPISDVVMVCLGMGLLATLRAWAEPIPIKLSGTFLETGIFEARPVSFCSTACLEPGTSETFLICDPEAKYRLVLHARALEDSRLPLQLETYNAHPLATSPRTSATVTVSIGERAEITSNGGMLISDVTVDAGNY